MFLNFYNYEKKKYFSPASRFTYTLKSNFYLNMKNKNLFFIKKWSAGRTNSGKIVNFKKKSLNSTKKKININYMINYNKTGVISNFFFLKKFNKILILIYFFDGSTIYLNATSENKIFSYFFYNFYIQKNFKKKNSYSMLFQFKKLSIINCLELLSKKNFQYARSSGTWAKIIKFNLENHTILIQLPSFKKKLFSFFSLALNGKNVFKFSNKLVNNKSGFWRNLGVKSTVRGVAKNAVDHPNGGRTKSLKLSKTPWGKITKLK